MMGSETKLHESLLQSYQEGEESMRGSEFVHDSIELLHQKISLKRGRSYIDSPKWLKNKKSNNKSKK